MGASMAAALILWREVGSAKLVAGSQLKCEQVDVPSVEFLVACVRDCLAILFS